ncbi:hypothetical protein C1H46_006726 [Malus baccata]|uniref:Late embryogenesis abundant protein LEA-2 subgroup domain-containing protein n=1 Tax=Malus baccata TaxID=106549 RepID=A0A540N9E8_MALBA|nr:hypothetical protein C1H46_006726 [Malus baccata]
MPRPWRDYCSCVPVILAILAILAILGVTAFSSYSLIWVFVHPNEPKITITDASLTQFDFAAARNNILNHNLALNFTIRNSNKRAGLDLVIGKYRNKNFFVASLSSTPFYQDHKNITIVPVVLQGQQWVKFQKRDVSRFTSETAAGVYNIRVEFYLRIRYKRVGILKKMTDLTKIYCKQVKVPLSSYNETCAGGFKFNLTKCKNVQGSAVAVLNWWRYRVP